MFQWQFDKFQLYADNLPMPSSPDQWSYIHGRAANLRQTFSDLHATFHIGDDQAWTSPAFAPFEDLNEREAQGVVERLCERFGA